MWDNSRSWRRIFLISVPVLVSWGYLVVFLWAIVVNNDNE